MARKPRLYQKLVRRRGSIGSHFSLWLASDHVLQMEANMFTERYQRMWLRDVMGFFIAPSRQARWVVGLSLFLLLLFVLLAVTNQSNEAELISWSIFSAISLLFLLYGLFGARNCHFYALTAVQRAEWPNVARRRQARKLIARLEPLIREAQRDTGGNAAAGVTSSNTAETVTGAPGSVSAGA